MKSISIIWPSIKDFADDLGVPYTTAHSWMRRGIPRGRYHQIIAAAKRRGGVIEVMDLIPLPATAGENAEDAA